MPRFRLALLFATLAAPACAQPLAGAAPDVTAIIDRADVDRDGRISRSELRDALRRAEEGAPAAFETYWRDRRSAIAGDAPVVSSDAGRIALGVLADADADRDGAVSAAEAQAYLATRPPASRQAALYAFAVADLDFDGVVTKEEIEALRRRVEALGETPKDAAPEGEDDATAKADTRKDFLEGKAREREAISEAWDRLSDANGKASAADLRREVFGGAD